MFGQTEEELHLTNQAAAGLVATGMPPAEAKRAAKDLVAKCKTRLKNMGILGATARVDQMLAAEKAGTLPPAAITRFAWARKHSATDQDLRFFWELSWLERLLDEELHQVVRMAAAMSFMEQDKALSPGGNLSDAMGRASIRMRASMALFGEPEEPSEWPEADRYLPWELRHRVSAWTGRITAEQRAEAKSYSSFNAFVRACIAAGKV